MKTLHTTTTRNANHSHQRVRSFLTLAGVVTAMLCLIALLHEARAAEHMETKVPRVLETSRMVAVDLLGQIKTLL